MIDRNTTFGARVESLLRTERIIWLVTVRKDGLPQPSPVWFLWDGRDFLVYSQPETQKLRNIARNPRVALHLDGDGLGGNIVVVSGEAELAADQPPADRVPGFVEKYDWGFRRLGRTAEEFARDYSVAIRVRATGLRGH
jgi:PPOX class probable F420-dependent enzyme